MTKLTHQYPTETAALAATVKNWDNLTDTQHHAWLCDLLDAHETSGQYEVGSRYTTSGLPVVIHS